MSDPTAREQPSGNVLIVEDDPDVRDMLAALLASEGFYPVAAEDGLEALHLLRIVRHRAPHVPCLILLDLMMPVVDGWQLIDQLRRDDHFAGVPVVVITAFNRDLGSAAALPVLRKPIELGDLLSVTNSYGCAG